VGTNVVGAAQRLSDSVAVFGSGYGDARYEALGMASVGLDMGWSVAGGPSVGVTVSGQVAGGAGGCVRDRAGRERAPGRAHARGSHRQ